MGLVHVSGVALTSHTSLSLPLSLTRFSQVIRKPSTDGTCLGKLAAIKDFLNALHCDSVALSVEIQQTSPKVFQRISVNNRDR